MGRCSSRDQRKTRVSQRGQGRLLGRGVFGADRGGPGKAGGEHLRCRVQLTGSRVSSRLRGWPSTILPEMNYSQSQHFENVRRKASFLTGGLGRLQGGGGI